MRTNHPLKIRLQRLGISQADLATEAGLPATDISAVLTGRRPCTAAMEARLQTALARLAAERRRAFEAACAP